MLFSSFFPKLKGQVVCVEMKDGKYFTGKLDHLDIHYNVILSDLVFDADQNYGYLRSLKKVFIRGTSVKFIRMDNID